MVILAFLLSGMAQETPASEAQVLGLLLKARWAEEKNQLSLAEEWIKQAVTIDPNNPDARYLEIEIKSNRLKSDPSEQLELEVINLLQKGIAQYPNDFRFPKRLGILLVKDSSWRQRFDLPEAESLLLRGLDAMDPNRPDLFSDIAESYYYLGQIYATREPLKAGNNFEKALEYQPDLEWAHFYAAQNFENAGLFRRALQFYVAFAEKVSFIPRSTQLSLQGSIARIQCLVLRTDAALNQLEKFYLEQKPGADFLWDCSEFFSRYGAYSLAQTTLSWIPIEKREAQWGLAQTRIALLRHKPVEALNLAIAGLAQFPRGEAGRLFCDQALDAALLSYDPGAYAVLSANADMLEQNPRTRFHWRAYQYGQGRKLEQAWFEGEVNSDFIHAIQLSGQRWGEKAAFHLFLARLSLGYRQYELALDLYGKLPREVRKDPEVVLEMADVFALAGQNSKAFKLYQSLIRKGSSNPSVYNNYGYFLAETGEDLPKALSLVEQALRLDPQCDSCMDSLGWAHFLQGQLAPAELWIRRSLQAAPNDAVRLDHLGDILFQKGEQEEAMRYWSRSMTIQDEFHLQDAFFDLLNKLDPAL
ncbi:MAG: tetratricopeptide repeat protein [Acidobacteria bacterium]|nr:tetratricopeptide repeat protein [Acidobacteriota bacterium]MCB9398354.1 tetratricopeptide repeat protein [Acidobacteriota bacterium]